MSESLLAMGDYDRISVREALGGGAGIPMFSLFTIHPSIIIGSFHSISTVSSLINKDKVESVVSSFFSVGSRSAAGHAARNFVEHGMTDEKLCNVSEEAYAPY
ncbi:hypothetical protein HanRHA438_Chr12g0551321 [Helianthus annuus]|uniref:Uncharacterized protein n=1 Tax=Helianthus annuus TaxID=4232 RepID=A0A251T2U1_HELAN|nr:hypothetical protein HanXRQr2_Chr12g0540481 [Helianthus annuus]KAJ0489318.1 hypothetical protein HanHA300_Chr12g0442651 [Helianthus annuus]KAJ0505198.1 hypothetical protein HanHA89_Chr12g0467771 [Helianthus annuus]KAJ0674881.1 hypothetical protein HanLR1_Chr12g0444881 [Helianthus annuus]KAJ0862609.1 hypothetical protein HanPSC8_Chr12g0520221 [Helianthus annuus]